MQLADGEENTKAACDLIRPELAFSLGLTAVTRAGPALQGERIAGSGGRSAAVIVSLYGNSLWKRLFDLAGSALLLLIMLPPFLIISLIIKIDSSGPVFFLQEHEGRDGTFNILKFRTMYVDATDPTASVQSSRGDARITRFGAILRRHSIDEMPQLLNVLRGQMSLVGPRPHALGTAISGKLVSDATDGYSARLSVRPGLTGLAQVSGCRGPLNNIQQLQSRLSQDLDYIRYASLSLDLKIIRKTLRLLLNDTAAY